MVANSRWVHTASTIGTLLICLGGWGVFGQGAGYKDGSLAGKVVNSVTGQPVQEARLTLSPVPRGQVLTTTTDAQGAFSFSPVKPGRYTLRGAMAGYANIAYGSTEVGASGVVLPVESGRSLTGLEYRLTPLGVIQGKVIDRNGEPVKGVTIACGFVDAYDAPATMESLKNVTDERGSTESLICRQVANTYRHCLRGQYSGAKGTTFSIFPHSIRPPTRTARLSRSYWRQGRKLPE